MNPSHKMPPKPSPLLAVICLAVVSRLRPDWVAVSLADAASTSGVRAERLSRLCSRAIDPFETIVASLSRIGRPPADRCAEKTAAADRDLLAALLDVATSLLFHLQPKGPWLRPLITGAWLRLKADHPGLRQKHFCAALALSARTLRQWLATPSAAGLMPKQSQLSTVTPAQPPKRPPRRGRFGFALTLPDTQLAADTTDLCAFGVPLKLIATQDVGGRDQDLLDSVIVDDHESADLVVHALTDALATHPGAQVITDQGTPYMAELTQAAIEALAAEHAPQREGDPLGKATIERAFGTVKKIARPLLSLTDQIAAFFPVLQSGALAKAAASLVIITLLKSYQAGARAAHRASEQRGGLSKEELVLAAQESREKAHAEDKSARLLLTHLYQTYDIGGPVAAFVRRFRRFPLIVLQRAERAFATQAHRGDICHRQAYFAAIVRRCDDAQRAEQAIVKRQRESMQAVLADAGQQSTTLERWADHPEEQLEAALGALGDQWHAPTGQLLFQGAGIGRAWLKQALSQLAQLHGNLAAQDIAMGLFNRLAKHHADRLGPAGTHAISALLAEHLRHLHPTAPPTADCAALCVGDILKKSGPQPRPPPSSPLPT